MTMDLSGGLKLLKKDQDEQSAANRPQDILDDAPGLKNLERMFHGTRHLQSG